TIDRFFLRALCQRGATRRMEFEVADIVGEEVPPHGPQPCSILRKLARVVIATMTRHARSRHELLLPTVQIHRWQQLPARSKDQKARYRLLAIRSRGHIDRGTSQ